MADITLEQLDAEAQAAVGKLGVPPSPHVVSKIGRELRLDVPDVHKIAELIAQDAASSAVILQTANAVLHGSGAPPRSVQQAIERLGLSQASYVLASLLLRNAFPASNKAALAGFWDSSTELALCAAYIAGEVGSVDRDEAHTFALFRDVGSAVLVCRFDDYDDASLRASAGAASNIALAEKARFGTDHTVIGAELTRVWQLPEEMSEAILWHHADGIFDRDPRPISAASARLIAIGALCDRIVEDYEAGASGATMELSAKALRVLDLSAASFEDLQAEATELLDQLDINAMPTVRVLRLNQERTPGE